MVAGVLLQGAERVLWQIGKVDYSTLEFNQNWDFSTRGEPKFSRKLAIPQRTGALFSQGLRTSPRVAVRTHSASFSN